MNDAIEQMKAQIKVRDTIRTDYEYDDLERLTKTRDEYWAIADSYMASYDPEKA